MFPRPVDTTRIALARLAQHPIRPNRSEYADRNVDPKHRAPVDHRKQAARNQSEELPCDCRNLVRPEREPPLLGRKRIREDRSGVGSQHRPSESLVVFASRSATGRLARRRTDRTRAPPTRSANTGYRRCIS